MKSKLSLALSTLLVLSAIFIGGCASPTPAPATTAPAPSEPVSAASAEPGNGTVDLGDGTLINPPGVFPIVVGDKPYVMSLFMPVWSGIKIEGNTLLEYWEKYTNVKLDLVPVNTDYSQQVNLMLASGEELPDAFSYNLGMDRLSTYGAQGQIIPVEDLIDKWCVNAQQIWDYTAPYGKASCTSLDGHIYGVPNFNGCFHCNYAHRGWINKKWLDNLGLQMPTTTEEYYNVLKAFKDQDANGNGDPNDEIPLIAVTDGWASTPAHFLMNSFVTDDVDYGYRMNVVNGALQPAYIQPEFKEGIKYINRLYSEGLLDKDAFVMTGAQAAMLGTNPKGNQVGSFFSGVPTMLSAEGDIPFQYEAIAPLKGPNGFQSTVYWPDMPSPKFAITKFCKHPEIAVRWADSWLENTPEMNILQRGKTSSNPDMAYLFPADTKYVGQNGNPAVCYIDATALWVEGIDCWLADAQPTFLTNEIREISVSNLNPEGFDQELVIYKAAKMYEPYGNKDILPVRLTFDVDASARVSELKTQITTYVNESFAAFVTGSKNVDKEWDAYVAEVKKMGVDELVQLLTDAWHTQYK